MRQHIGNAMKNRSKTLLSALNDYNQAASELKPPRKLLKWDDIMAYTYLSEFDFLKDSSEEIMEKPWAKPVVREGMSEFFKLLGAKDELERLHVEIKRLLTKMKEEEDYYAEAVRQAHPSHPELALQIQLHGMERHQFHIIHRKRLKGIQKLKGFDRQNIHFFQPGVGVRRQTASAVEEYNSAEGDVRDTNASDDEDEDEEEEEEFDDQAAAILSIANDPI